MITFSCGLAHRHPQAIELDWQRYCINNEEKTYAFADLLWLADINNCKVWIRGDGYNRARSLFVRKFIEPHIVNDRAEECEPQYAYWPLPDGSTRAVLYRIAQFDKDKDGRK